MKVSARVVKTGIRIKRLGKTPQAHVAGTVIMKSVSFGRAVMGEFVEESDRVLIPRSEDGTFSLAVKNWQRARYVSSLGGYYNLHTGEKVSSAKYVYMTNGSIYYTI